MGLKHLKESGHQTETSIRIYLAIDLDQEPIVL